MAKKNFKAAVDAKRNTRTAVPQVDPSGIEPTVQPVVTPVPTPRAEKKIVVKPVVKATSKVEESPILYTTRIYKKQRMQVKMHALTEDINDQEVVQRALDEYFRNHPV